MDEFVDPALYSPRVLELFETTPRAGEPAGANRCGAAASKPRASEVRLHLRVGNGRIEAAGFHVLACPHTIAAAALVCADIEGRRIDELAGYAAGFLDAALPLPAD